MPSALPPFAQQRLARLTAGPTRTSLLSMPAVAALDAVGFDPVGEVMGAAAMQFVGNPEFIGSCAAKATYAGVYQGTSGPAVRLGAGRYSRVAQEREAYTRALTRLRAEARELGADGVVGIALSERRATGAVYEVVATGTAVRARSRTRAARPFTTDLPGSDLAALMLAGWVPVALHVVIEAGVRHDDTLTLRQTGRRSFSNPGNTEVSGYSELVQAVRHSAEARWRAALKAAGADGGLLTRLSSHSWHVECMTVHGDRDRATQATAIGTSIARFETRRASAPSQSAGAVVPLRDQEDR